MTRIAFLILLSCGLTDSVFADTSLKCTSSTAVAAVSSSLAKTLSQKISSALTNSHIPVSSKSPIYSIQPTSTDVYMMILTFKLMDNSEIYAITSQYEVSAIPSVDRTYYEGCGIKSVWIATLYSGVTRLEVRVSNPDELDVVDEDLRSILVKYSN
jgi:hypothetical protein